MNYDCVEGKVETISKLYYWCTLCKRYTDNKIIVSFVLLQQQHVAIGHGEKTAQKNATVPKTAQWYVKNIKALAFVHLTLKVHHVKKS